jgi:hypothetical protein
MKYIGIFDVITQTFVMVVPEEHIEDYRKYLDSQEYILFKLEKYEWKLQTEI